MKLVKIYLSNSRKPLIQFHSEGGDLMKHEIANNILMSVNTTEYSKIRVTVEDEE